MTDFEVMHAGRVADTDAARPQYLADRLDLLARRLMGIPDMAKDLAEAARMLRAQPAAGGVDAPATGWTGNPDADLALILLDRLDDEGEGNATRIEQLEGLVRKLSASRPAPPAPAVLERLEGLTTYDMIDGLLDDLPGGDYVKLADVRALLEQKR